MTVIWVANEVKKNGKFKQTKAEVLCTASCVLFIKQYYPNWKTVIFLDKSTKEYYNQFGMLDLFDEVNDTLLDEPTEINTDIFWAAGKIRAQRFVEGPTLTIDLDFRFYTNLMELGFFDADVSGLWLEQTDDKYYYISPEEALSNTGMWGDYDWDNRALNVSILYLKNNEFKNLYCDWVLKYMERVSDNFKGQDIHLNDIYILFAEQYMLNQLIKKNNQQVKVLINNFENKTLPDYVTGTKVEFLNAGNFFYHYGTDKQDMRVKNEKYYREINHSHSITNQIITNKKHLEVFNKIYNIDENEGCFC
jgi:hypothetical protein